MGVGANKTGKTPTLCRIGSLISLIFSLFKIREHFENRIKAQFSKSYL